MDIDYFAYKSDLKNINSKLKLIFAIAVMFFSIGYSNMVVSLYVIITMAFIILALGKTPLRLYIRLIKIPFIFIIMSVLPIALDFSLSAKGEYSMKIIFFYAYTDKANALKAVNVFFKAMAGVSCLYMLSLSTPLGDIIGALRGLRLPNIICELMILIYRYIFILMDIAHKMQMSAKSRLGYISFKNSLRAFAYTGGSMFVAFYNKSNDYYNAMVSRGYTDKIELLEENRPIKLKHIIYIFVYILLLNILGYRGCRPL